MYVCIQGRNHIHVINVANLFLVAVIWEHIKNLNTRGLKEKRSFVVVNAPLLLRLRKVKIINFSDATLWSYMFVRLPLPLPYFIRWGGGGRFFFLVHHHRMALSLWGYPVPDITKPYLTNLQTKKPKIILPPHIFN